jgi:hypothetical protein
MAKKTKKAPKEATNLFQNIIKASVKENPKLKQKDTKSKS